MIVCYSGAAAHIGRLCRREECGKLGVCQGFSDLNEYTQPRALSDEEFAAAEKALKAKSNDMQQRNTTLLKSQIAQAEAPTPIGTLLALQERDLAVKLHIANGRLAEMGDELVRLSCAYGLAIERLLKHELLAEEAPAALAGTIQERVDAVVNDVLAGRLTQPQKRGLKSAIDRSERITPDSDAAVGKAIR